MPRKKLTTEEFIQRAIKVHRNRYDYYKVNYINSSTKVYIICPIHGEFFQTPNSHLSGQGCPKCKFENLSKLFTSNFIDFVNKSNKIHNNKYDYSLVEYKNNKTKVKIICKEHGIFEQIPNHHYLCGSGCPKCKGVNNHNRNAHTTKIFINEANKIHYNLYDYSKVDYYNCMTKVEIICKKHGSFWQTPDKHLNGHRCSKCYSSKGELTIEKWLKDNNIKYICQKKI